jgi:hypothetical protein
MLRKYDMPAAFVGNYHQHQVWQWHEPGDKNRVIVQIGALNPTGFGDEGCRPGTYGGLALWDGHEVEWVEVPGPRFVKVLAGDELPSYGYRDNTIHVRAEKPVNYQDGKDKADTETYYFGRYEEVEPGLPQVMVSPNSSRPALLESAEQAIEEYVSKMGLPEGVDRADVLAETKKLWRQA